MRENFPGLIPDRRLDCGFCRNLTYIRPIDVDQKKLQQTLHQTLSSASKFTQDGTIAMCVFRDGKRAVPILPGTSKKSSAYLVTKRNQ